MITAALVSAKCKTDGTRKVRVTPAFRCYVLLNVIKRQQTEQLCTLLMARGNVWNSLSFPLWWFEWYLPSQIHILMLGFQFVERLGKDWSVQLCWRRFVSGYELWDSKSLLQYMFSFSVVFVVPEVSSQHYSRAMPTCLFLCYYGNRFTLWNSKPSPNSSINCLGVLSQQ